MKDRWLPVGVLAATLFAINVVARLVTRLAFDGDPELADRVSLAMFALIAILLAGVAFVEGRRHPVDRWVTDVAAALLVAMVLTVFVGPFVSGTHPFSGGAGEFFAQIWLYAACTIGGTIIGYLLLMSVGLDHRSQSLKRYAEEKRSRPRRVVRR